MPPKREIKNDPLLFRFSMYGFLKNLRFFEPFLVLFFRDAGLSFFQIGVLYAVRDISTNLLEIPAGVVADTAGRRRSMVLSFLSYIVSFIVFYTLPGFASYALAMVIFGIGEAFRSGTHKALILEHLRLSDMEDLKVTYYGRTRAASQMGSALNSLIAASLVFCNRLVE
jgi:MFS family permease